VIPIETLIANVDPSSVPLIFMLAIWIRSRFDRMDRRLDRLEAMSGVVPDGGSSPARND